MDELRVTAPSWLTRQEKAEFRRLQAARMERGLAISAREVDTLADLVTVRTRLRSLRALEAKAEDTGEKLRLGRAVEAALSTSHRLSRALFLLG